MTATSDDDLEHDTLGNAAGRKIKVTRTDVTMHCDTLPETLIESLRGQPVHSRSDIATLNSPTCRRIEFSPAVSGNGFRRSFK
ncbi:hypothetical protein [Sphingomonas sp. 10B4]|uniref:hypothetical protein n=1 Tax=Sphingomonas sp. 10B4 TaxID=3048575 RepID=UPI002AB36037|nr:hypothetical protein [Sphingomonas sp. 10B4]MDY7524628.1 hypothetical protein [Sphingomonas sp. 10B4]